MALGLTSWPPSAGPPAVSVTPKKQSATGANL
eukprot:CAMPEP_0180658018 /NCGR_PEP_ID=MMETSP1037_2-20121125/56763_1 /TAXON_ID=632150 /ORGANISM="Azadinium spinosum, Strain 3D9" /LENGTH=31 /DNA_ID= /DNA_START= /DNA_END= /DNA_ORIENTATION=